ncbi:MAG: hypothetical protein ACPF9D_04140 [Owenweeksia sp.]
MTVRLQTNAVHTEHIEKLTFHLNVNYPTLKVRFKARDSESTLSLSSPQPDLDKPEILELIRCLGFTVNDLP